LVSASAQSIIESGSYDALWRARLLPYMKASTVNRAVYSKLSDVAKKGFWQVAGKSNRPDNFMRWLYNFSPLHRLLYPFVAPK
jgi:hypothetical protein